MKRDEDTSRRKRFEVTLAPRRKLSTVESYRSPHRSAPGPMLSTRRKRAQNQGVVCAHREKALRVSFGAGNATLCTSGEQALESLRAGWCLNRKRSKGMHRRSFLATVPALALTWSLAPRSDAATAAPA